jgi:hypothetical protein
VKTAMNTQPASQKDAQIHQTRRNLRRRIFAAVLMGALTLAAPAIASVAPAPHREVRVPRLDRRAIENLQRWANDGHDTWCGDAQPAPSAEFRRIAPEFDGYQFGFASLPLEAKSHAAEDAIHTGSSLDGRTA